MDNWQGERRASVTSQVMNVSTIQVGKKAKD